MNRNLEFFAKNNYINSQYEEDYYFNNNFPLKNQDDNDDIFSLLEYNIEEEEESFNQLAKLKDKKEECLIFSNEKNSDENNIPSNQILNIFRSCEEKSKSIYSKEYNSKDASKNDYLNISEVIQKEVDTDCQILVKKNPIKEKIELKGEKEKQSLKDKKGIIESHSVNDINYVIQKEDNGHFINDDKKKKFVSFKIFNPKGISEDLKDIRNLINKVIFKKEDSNVFKIKRKGEKEITKKRKRKHKPDDIRKKIKARFLKALKNRINEELQYANSTKYFDFLPQCFNCEITKEKNKEILNMTLREIITTNFFEKYNKKKKIKENNNQILNNMLNKKRNYDYPPDIVKYNNNIEVIKYLENNEVIKKHFNFDNIGNMTFTELFNEYLESNEFEKEIFGLKFKEDYFYIKEYIIKAFAFIKDFLN